MKLFVSILLIALFMLQISFAIDEKHACGAASLYHLATILGIEVSLEKTADIVKEKREGSRVVSFADIIACAKEIGLALEGVKLTYQQLQQLNTPVIAHLRTTFEDENPSAGDATAVGHFIVVEHATKKWVRLFDTPKASLRDAATVISKDRFLELWTGRTLVLSKKQQHQRSPVLYTSPALADFGKYRGGEYGIPTQLRNRSDIPIEILSVNANCSCIVVKQDGNIVPAGGTDFLHINWNTSVVNRSLFTTIHLQTDAPQRPHTFISLGILREFSVVFVPETIYLRSTGTSKTKRTVGLQNLKETTVKIQKIESSQEWIQPILRSNTVIYPWRAADIELHFETDQMPRGTFDEMLTLHYVDSDQETKTLILPISGKVDDRYTLNPNRFFFGRIDASEGKTKAVVLHNLSGTDIEIEKVDTDVGTAQVKRLKDENRYQVQLTLPLLLPTGILKGKVRIHTNHPKIPLIQVPVFAIVSK